MSQISFSAHARWTGGDAGSGQVSSQGLAPAQISLPAELGGAIPGTNPEELLLSSLSACLSMTLAFMYEGRDLPFKLIEVEAKGFLVRGPLRFERVAAKITVHTERASDSFKLEELARLAHEKCLISAIVKKSCPLTFDVEIRQGT